MWLKLASAFVAAELGIPTDIPQHASYIANWIQPLKDDKREITDVQLAAVDAVAGWLAGVAETLADTAVTFEALDLLARGFRRRRPPRWRHEPYRVGGGLRLRADRRPEVRRGYQHQVRNG